MCVLDLCNGSELCVRGVAEFVPTAGYSGDGANGGRGPTGLPEENAAAEVSGGRDQLKNVCLNESISGYIFTFGIAHTGRV